ncbi:MAG: hypothetical protein GXP39_19555 [Chloroflexi bacterium]|nr:hypothetical protein [Chloroflexota bacterium]
MMLETRRDLLRKVALASKALGILLLIIGVIGLIAGLTAGGNMPAIVTSLVRMAALFILITGVFFFIILYAVGDMVLVLLGIEENTRQMREQLARSATASPSRSGSAARSGSRTTSSRSTVTPSESSSAARSKEASAESEDEAVRRAADQARRAAEIARKSKESGSSEE